MLFSVNVNDAAVPDVVPRAIVPALVTEVDANAAGAATVAKREPRSAALMPTLNAFFLILKVVLQ